MHCQVLQQREQHHEKKSHNENKVVFTARGLNHLGLLLLLVLLIRVCFLGNLPFIPG